MRLFGTLLANPATINLIKGTVHVITKTCLYKVDPLKPHFYIVKLGFTGVYIIFLISIQKHRLWVPVRTEAVLTGTHNLCFEQKCERYQNFDLKIFIFFLVVKFSVYLNRRVFVMGRFSTMIYKVGNFCDLLYMLLHTKPILKRGSKFFSLRVDPPF